MGRPAGRRDPPGIADGERGTRRSAAAPGRRAGGRRVVAQAPAAMAAMTRSSNPSVGRTRSHGASDSSSRAIARASASSASDGSGSPVGAQLGRVEPPAGPVMRRLPVRPCREVGARPRRRWVLTVPSGRSVWRAISSSDQLAEEPQRHDLTIRLREDRDRAAHVRRMLGANGEHAPGPSAASPPPTASRGCGVGLAGRRPRSAGSSHVDRSPLAGLANGDAHGDARQPRAERPVAPPARRAIDRRSRRPPGRHLRPRVGRRGLDDMAGRPRPIRARPGAGRHRGRRQGRRRRSRDHPVGLRSLRRQPR